AEHPDDATEDGAVIEREGPAYLDHRELEHDEEQTPRREIARKPLGISELVPVKKGRGAGQENERRRTEVRHPPREKHSRRWTAGRYAGIHTDVIDRHQHHDEPAHHINPRDASRA